jgi:hypothetical protein
VAEEPQSDATEWLEEEDTDSREDRAARLEWLVQLMPPVEHHLFWGGELSVHLFEEAKYSFVYGQFLATIFLGLAFIERTLAAIFYAGGRTDLERSNITVLLEEARGNRLLTPDEFDMIDRLRRIRNPIAHFREPMHPEGIIRRVVESNALPYELFEHDARQVLMTVYHLLGTGLLSPGAG